MVTKVHFQKRSLIVADHIMSQSVDLATRAAKTNAPVLLRGESGTGKELLARLIHEKSRRSDGPFVSVNCAAVPEGLMEAEFFGYERGAFTGAIAQRIGKFEMANRGTLLLDEISEMPFSLQAKLLRVLQEGEIDRLGSRFPIPIDCRIIATTNREPLQLIKEGKFRDDLYYRLNVIRVDCVALRNRPEAISSLAEGFAKEIAEESGLSEVPHLEAAAIEKLQKYSWPGNIRELRNAIERAIWLADGKTIHVEHLDSLNGKITVDSPDDTLNELERSHIENVLEKTQGNRAQAAQRLGITARTLRNKLKLYQD